MSPERQRCCQCRRWTYAQTPETTNGRLRPARLALGATRGDNLLPVGLSGAAR